MIKVTLRFSNIGIEKCNFLYFKHLINIINVDIDKIIISNKVFVDKNGFIYFCGYQCVNKIVPLCIKTYKNDWV